MKNTILYYYNLEPLSIRQRDNFFNFDTENGKYTLVKIENNNLVEIEEGYKLSLCLVNNNLKSNIIILNNNNQIITNINNDFYIMIKLLVDVKPITFDDVISFSNLYATDNNSLNKSNWFDLWIKKVDYFEYQISQMGLKYSIIRESFSYYIGLAELAINLTKDIPETRVFTLSHRRISYNDTTFHLYNPLNYIIDYRFRDVCEYFKSAFFNGVDVLNSIKMYLNYLNKQEKQLFLARFLFPTYYFDTYEKIIQNEVDEIEIRKIINKVEQFELLLKKIYNYVADSVPYIEFLKEVINY